MYRLSKDDIARCIAILQKVEPTKDDADFLCWAAEEFELDAREAIDGPSDTAEMRDWQPDPHDSLPPGSIEGLGITRSEEQLQRESDERAAFNERMDNHFNEK